MPVPDHILVYARQLRGQLTDAEDLLWFLLRDRRFCGAKFRRQHPVAGYILDFYCHASRLAIELDGSGHSEPHQVSYDNERTAILQGAGIVVLRFWNHDVLNNTKVVLEKIHEVLATAPGSGQKR